MPRKDFLDITGQTFGRLTVVRRAESINARTMWECRCECGTLIVRQGAHIKHGTVLSCGCLRREMAQERARLFQPLCAAKARTHGMTNTREFTSWSHMKERCANPNHHARKWYSQKGITVCDRWMHSFDNFLSDMGTRPDGCDLDRIDSSKGYSPDNCRWLNRRVNSLRALPNMRHLVEGVA